MVVPATRPASRRPAAAATAPPEPRLTVAPPPVAVPRARFVVLVLLVVGLGVLGILLLNTRINENAFRLHELRQEQAKLDQRQQQLDERIAEANSTAQLSAAARRLGLVRVGGDELGRVRLPSGEVVGEPVPVTEEDAQAGEEAQTDVDAPAGEGSQTEGSQADQEAVDAPPAQETAPPAPEQPAIGEEG